MTTSSDVTKRQYHLQTGPKDLAARCLLVGDPERAEYIASTFFTGIKEVGDHRGLKSFTGYYHHTEMSVITHGMGSASIGIILPEAVRSGAKMFIRIGSCGALRPEIAIGDSIIFTGSVRYDGASENWAPMEYPALADYRIVSMLENKARTLGSKAHVGIGATTSCFYEGQARYGLSIEIPKRMMDRHEELIKLGVLSYSMEEAALFIWCSANGFAAGAIDTVYANRCYSETPHPPATRSPGGCAAFF